MNRLGLSTLGLPGASLDQALRLAAEAGFEGLELRCAQDQPVWTDLDELDRLGISRAFRGAGLKPIALAGYLHIAAPGPDGPVLAALRRHIWLAADIGAPFLRVFPGGSNQVRREADAAAARRLQAVAGLTRACGVRILVETHDSHRAAADTARLLRGVGDTATGAIWDVLHTHLAGDQPSDAYDQLAYRLGYIQVKGATAPHRDATPVQLGTGALHPEAAIHTALDAGYAGWFVWEYEAPWHPEAAPLPPLLAPGRTWLTRQLRRHRDQTTPRAEAPLPEETGRICS
ncbi:sugar phosphate isomerase/epimerase [Streptacidiphilus sp. MAP12-20]|uniref:sugar phosphate isomerase/epimerase family protein n=1 Tax=Streptacidiphilus sp. MAP12-20 TaxID=3156299 RepID=UPI003513BB7B